MGFYAKNGIESIGIFYEKGQYRLTDNETGETCSGKSLENAYKGLVKQINEYKSRPEIVKEEHKKRAAEIIKDMIRDEAFRCILLVGLISYDNNRSEAQINCNLERFKWLESGIKLVTPKNGNQAKALKEIEDYIKKGIDVLEKEEIRVPLNGRIEELFDLDTLYRMRNLYNSYFDVRTVSENSRNRYIEEKFGKCEEPTYDRLWNVWYLGDTYRNGTRYYHVGPATEIFGRFLGFRVDSASRNVDAKGKTQFSCGVDVESAFRKVWEIRKEDSNLVIEDETLLSPKQWQLLNKVEQYGKEHRN